MIFNVLKMDLTVPLRILDLKMVFPHCLEVLGLNFNNKNSRKCIYSDCEHKRTSYNHNNIFTLKMHRPAYACSL